MIVLRTVADGVDRFVRVIGEVMAWTSLVMVLLIAFNVFARYLFSFGIVAFQELEWHLMAVGALFGMSYALNRGDEVRVDVLYDGFSDRAKLVVDTLASFLLLASCLIIAYLSLGFVAQSFALGEGSADPGGLPMRWIIKACIPAAFALLALQAFSRLLLQVDRLIDVGAAKSQRRFSES